MISNSLGFSEMSIEQEGESMSDESGDQSAIQDALKLYHLGRYQQAIPILKQQTKLYMTCDKRTAQKDIHQLCRIRFFLGNCHFMIREIKEAQHYYDYVYEDQCEAPDRKAERLNNLGCCLSINKEYCRAFDCFNKAIGLYLKLKKSGLALLYRNIGHLYEINEMPSQALQFYSVALLFAEEIAQSLVVSNVDFRARLAYLVLRTTSKSPSGTLGFPSIFQKIIPYLDASDGKIEKSLRLNIQIELLRVSLARKDIPQANKRLQLIDSCFNEEKEEFPNLNAIKAETYYSTAASFYALEEYKQCQLLLKSAKVHYELQLKEVNEANEARAMETRRGNRKGKVVRIAE